MKNFTKDIFSKDRLLRFSLVFLVFFLLTVYYTWPLILHFNTAVFGIWGNRNRYGGDMFSSIYSYWLIKYLIDNSLSLFKSPLTIFPFGAVNDYTFGSGRPIGEVLASYPITVLTSEIFTFNFFIFSSFVLSGIITFGLAWKITKNFWASIISGFIFSFSPYHLYVSCGWVELSQVYWFPLFFYCLLKTNETKKACWGISTGIVLALTCLTILYYGYFLGMTATVFIIFKLIWDFKKTKKIDWIFIKKLLLGFMVGGLIIIAGFYKRLPGKILGSDNYEKFRVDDLILRSARPLDYILPSIDHPVFGNISRDLLDNHLKFTHNVFDISLGWTTLVLAIFGSILFIKSKKGKDPNSDFSITFILVMGITALVLSMPPYFNFLGLKIPLPSHLIYYLTPMFKSVSRYGVVVMCSVSILAGVCLDYFSKNLSSVKKIILYTVVFSLIFMEFQNKSMFVATSFYKTPEAYQWLAEQPENFAIAEYPPMLDLDFRNMYYKYFQRLHKKPIINGAQAQTADDLYRISLFDITASGTQKLLKAWGVKYAVIHDEFYQEYYQLDSSLLHMLPPLEIKGLKLIKKFDKERIYEIIAEPEKIIIITGGDFYQTEKTAGKKGLWHSLKNSAIINFYNSEKLPVVVDIDFKAETQLDSAILYLINGNQGYPVKLKKGVTAPVNLKISLNPGGNIFGFVSQDKPVLLEGGGNKQVTVQIGEISVTTVDNKVYGE